ncbi:MAG: PDR/VanB family oxidoreductase [Janthinobacterium lividum]
MDATAYTLPDGQDQLLSLLVRQVRFEAVGINSYELAHMDGHELPETAPGSHLDVHLPGGLVRQYSLCGDPANRHRYTIAVLKEESGRGGSRLLHETLQVQNVVTVGRPRNNFALVPDAGRHILVGGGIGITPLKTMAHQLAADGKDYTLHYCAKSAEHAAFGKELAVLDTRGQIHFHYDDGRPGEGLDIARLLAERAEGDHLYYCGPGGFMHACAAASAHWPAGTVHSEHFKAPVVLPTFADDASAGAPDTFVVEIASTGAKIDIPAGRSIVDVLAEANIHVETSCVSGLCGSCKVGYLNGTVDHRDFILSEDEQKNYLTTCVSRATSQVLLLDL